MEKWNGLYQFIMENRMIEPGDTVIAAVSGGADSVLLLRGLQALSGQLGCRLHVCHVNHMLRGEAAKEDEAFVCRLAKEMGVPAAFCRVDVGEEARRAGLSVEEAGRYARRRFFEETANRLREADGNIRVRIATAHHMDDLAETMLMNLSRGCALRGLGGLWPVQGMYIKPLLCMTREQIEAALSRMGQPYRTDETNADVAYTRNRIRRQVIPVLKEHVNGQMVRHFREAAQSARSAWMYIDRQADQIWSKTVIQEGGGYLLRSDLAAEDPFIGQIVCKRAMEKAAGSAQDIGGAHVTALWELFGRQPGRRIDLPYAMTALRCRQGIRLLSGGMHKAASRTGFADREWAVRIPGKTDVPGMIPGNGPWQDVISGAAAHPDCPGMSLVLRTRWIEAADLSGETSIHIPQRDYTKWIDYDRIKDRLVIRNRRPKDRIVIDRLGRTKKLKKLFVDEKIDSACNRSWPLIADGDEIVWIPGLRLSSRYFVDQNTQRILELELIDTRMACGGEKDGRED